jgi:NAD(P)H-hydrate epimerase
MELNNIPAVTRAQMVEVDRLMVEEYGITLLQMMENAGRNLAQLSRQLLRGAVKGKRISVLCGGGNNGGGGMAAARHLANWGADVQVALAVPAVKLKDAPAHQMRALRAMGVNISDGFPSGNFDLMIDALIGYGLRGAPRGEIAQWIQKANRSDVPILSLDIPSGLDADTGGSPGDCIRADATLTLALPKVGMREVGASEYLGELYIGDISVPTRLLQEIGIEMVDLFTSSPIVKVS